MILRRIDLRPLSRALSSIAGDPRFSLPDRIVGVVLTAFRFDN
jgi:hypothetical protein